MGEVSWSIETPAVWSRLDKHQIAARIRGAVGHAVEVGVKVHARAQLWGEPLLPGPLDDLGDCELRLVGILAMKECGRQPYLVGHL
jgi:chloramphenicol 3-O-phosphotransferase